MSTLFFWIILTVCATLLQLFISKKPKNLNRVLELLLQYTLFIVAGFGSIWAFMGHAFLPDKIASYIGWASGSPFQFEVAVANLAFGILGILSLWIKDNFRSASVIAVSVFYWGAAYGHITDMMKHHNYAPGNTGAPVYFDIIFPLILIALLVTYKISLKKSKQREYQKHNFKN